jgi:hypothetical protein
LSGGTHQELKKEGSSHPPEETEASFAKQKSPAGRQMTVAVEINFPPNRDWKKHNHIGRRDQQIGKAAQQIELITNSKT